jgi:hypothetical protein
MKQKSPYTIHTDPRNAIVRDGAILIIGPGQVAFRGRKGNLTPEDLADAWTLATILRDGDDAQAVPDVPAAVEILREERDELREIVERQATLIGKLQQQRRDMRAALRATFGLLEKYVPDAPPGRWQLSDHAEQIYAACRGDEEDG